MKKEFQEIDKMKKIDKHMMATTATHKLGDLSREGDEIENLCRVTKEDDENYYGMWITGMGFFNVQFPKATTRELTEVEIKKFNKMRVAINNQPSMPLKVD